MEFNEFVEFIVKSRDYGKASACKRGRNPAFPYVPVVVLSYGWGTTNPSRGLAYATREEAVARAQACIDAQRDNLRQQLLSPGCRSLRVSFGLPRELPQ